MKSSWEEVQLNEDRLLKEQIREEINCKHVAFYLVDSKVFDSDGTEIGCTGGGLIKCTDCEKSVFDIQQENTQLKSELQALRELLKEVEFNWDAACNICHETMKHEPGCRMKAELDKLKGVE
jgi:uncharacterized protein YfcZ (UPF0381/DUF406 family)